MRLIGWAACLWLCGAGVASAGDLDGRWQAENAPEAVVEVIEKTGTYQGHIVSHSENPQRVGSHVLRDWQAVDGQPGQWRGTLYVPRRDREMPARIEQSQDDQFTLVVDGLLRERRILWTRVR